MKIINFVICDDIRSEIGNKVSLMGVYSNELTFANVHDGDGVWPQDLNLGVMLEFFVTADTQKRARKFKISYAINNVEKMLGEGKFSFPSKEKDSNGDFRMSLFAKSTYHFEAGGTLTHCIKIFDSNDNEIARATPANTLLIKESIEEQ